MKEIRFNKKEASKYEEYAERAVFGYNQLYQMTLALLMDEKSINSKVLVVGSGSGKEMITFGNYMPFIEMTGVDPSEEMIKISRKKIEEKGLDNKISLYKGTIEDLPPNIKYNIATVIFVLRFVDGEDEKLFLLRRINELLKSGGRILIIDQFEQPLSQQFNLLRFGWKNFLLMNGISVQTAEMIIEKALEKRSLITENKLKRLLAESGYHNIVRFYSAFLHAGFIAEKI